MKKVLFIAPHPDDETLGCGGTILKHKANGDQIYWLIVTSSAGDDLLNKKYIRQINIVNEAYEFLNFKKLSFQSAFIDREPLINVIKEIGKYVLENSIEIMYVPYRNDAHSDHQVVFDASIACSKSFRYPSVKSIRAYETLSETNFNIKPNGNCFRPNLYIDISEFVEKKIKIFRYYETEIGKYPFPRSEECIESLWKLRGSEAGVLAAESFMILKEIQ